MRKILKLLMTGLLIGCSSTTVANNNPSQPRPTSETDSVPPISSFAFEACNFAFAINECTTFPKQQHWGKVKEIKIFNVSEIKQLPDPNKIQVFVKSKGCYGYYDSPQKEAWYPINIETWAKEGKTPKASLVDNKVMQPELRKAFVEVYGKNVRMLPNDCNPIELED